MSQAAKDFIFWVGLSMVLVVLVVRGNGAGFVKTIGGGLTNIIQAATGGSVTRGLSG